MIFDEIPTELKEHIFSYVTPNEWINTAKVSKEWLELTLRSIKKVESCHLLILDHLAELINQQRDTNYTWVSLLTLMPRLEHLECCENTEDFWRQINPFCHKLKILHFKPRNDVSYDWTKLDISFSNLVELLWDGTYQGRVFPLNLFASSPKLEKIIVTDVEINVEWLNKIPKFVKHILVNRNVFEDDNLLNYLFGETSALETFPRSVVSQFVVETPRLKHLECELLFSDIATSLIIKNALRRCQSLETVKARSLIITDRWRRLIPQNIKSVNFFKMNVQENIRPDYSFDWLFQNYASLQSLQVKWGTWTEFDAQKFYSTENLKKLVLDNYGSHYLPERSESMEIFSDVCLRMIRGSHLVDVEICKVTIDESWRHIFPSTIKRLTLKDVYLSNEAQLVFSPQFTCENPSKIESLMFGKFDDDLPAMDLNAFTEMHMLRELNLNNLRLSGQCLQSILTHCSALTKLCIQGLTDDALTHIPRTLILPSLRKLHVKEAVDQPSLLLQHFPKIQTLYIAIMPSEEYFSDIMNALPEVETAEIKIRMPTWHLLRSFIESIDVAQFKYYCLNCEISFVSFYLTNSLLNACKKLNDLLIFKERHTVLKVNNYPNSSLLRKNLSRIPSSIDELSQRYHELMYL